MFDTLSEHENWRDGELKKQYAEWAATEGKRMRAITEVSD